MSGFARAERRRQERAAAKTSGQLGVRQRADDDCMRAAVATVLGIAYEETPPILGFSCGGDAAFSDAWQTWARERGLAMRVFHSHAPAFLDSWIASVDGYGRPDETHACVMRRDRLAHDPTFVDEARRTVVAPDDVRSAVIIGTPAWITDVREQAAELAATGSRDVWPILRPEENPMGVAVLRAQGRDAEADAMEQRLSAIRLPLVPLGDATRRPSRV